MSEMHSSSILVDSTDIQLTPQETQLRNLLLDVAQYIDESKEIKERLELRFAGGWVRDKLLDIPSNDIDTAINVMTGDAFSLKLRDYLKAAENLSKHGLNEKDVHNIHKIAANPEKSKHLETVTTNILGFDVDFVNLRKETYSEDSRNPQMEFGTAQEDALRRDATVNALFYNLHTDKVEDFAGGLRDLRSRRIKTPLEPHQTFMDDPLRVLRLVRFASRLGFEIDERSKMSMADKSIQQALKLKISRERIGVELEKMLKETDPNKPRRALQLINDLGLYSTIFTDPTTSNFPQPATNKWKLSYDCLHFLASNEPMQAIYNILVYKAFVPNVNAQIYHDAPYVAWILASLSPWAKVVLPTQKGSSGRLLLPSGTIVARKGIKSPTRICNIVTVAIKHLEEIMALKKAVNAREGWIQQRDRLGMDIRRWDKDGGRWRLQVLFAILVEAMESNTSNDLVHLIPGWQLLIEHLRDMDLLNAESIKPLIDGDFLQGELHAKPGRWVARALELCLEWQFRNPGNEDKMAAIQEVKRRSNELQISYR